MTQIILQNSINNTQMNVLMGLFNSWNVDVVITEGKKSENKPFTQRFARTRGMWKDYDIASIVDNIQDIVDFEAVSLKN